jgi:hypothetical protein
MGKLAFLSSTLDGDDWRALYTYRSATGGKYPAPPFALEAGLTSEPVWKIWRSENSWPYVASNSSLSTVQPIASRFTDWATLSLETKRARNSIPRRPGFEFRSSHVESMVERAARGQVFSGYFGFLCPSFIPLIALQSTFIMWIWNSSPKIGLNNSIFASAPTR